MNQVIYGGESVINELVYGARSDALIQELKNHISVQNPMLTEQGRLYAQQATQVFEEVSGWDAVRAARKAVSAVDGYVRSNQISPLTTVEELQVAPPRMQRWVMCEPATRLLYQEGRIDGYSESYVDIQPNAVGKDHYDHRLAISGLVRGYEYVEDDVEQVRYELTQTHAELASWDEPLTPRNVVDIGRMHQVQRRSLFDGADDFTSRFGGKI
jgi:hypothetical protein